MEKSEDDLNQLYTLANIISNGITINTGEETILIPGLFDGIEHTQTDVKLLFAAIAMVFGSNDIKITIDSYKKDEIKCSGIDVFRKKRALVGGADGDEDRLILLASKLSQNPQAKVILDIEPSSGRKMVNNLVRIIICIITLFFTIKVLFYLFESRFKLRVTFFEASIEDVKEKYGVLLPSKRIEYGKKLIQNYMTLGKENTAELEVDVEQDENKHLEPYLQALALSYKDMTTESSTQLQIYTVDDPLPPLEELDLNNLGIIAPKIIKGYQLLFSFLPFLKIVDIDEFIQNYAIFQQAQQKYTEIDKEMEDLKQLFNTFKKTLAEDIASVNPSSTTDFIQDVTGAVTNLFTGFFSGKKNSNIDNALAKKMLIQEIIGVWTEIFQTTATNSNNMFRAITTSFTQITNLYALLQWQIVIVGMINAFITGIIFKYVIKNKKVELTPEEFIELINNIVILIPTVMNDYFQTNISTLNLPEKEELIEMITILIKKNMFKAKKYIDEDDKYLKINVSQKTSNIVGFDQQQAKILEDVKKFIIELNEALEKIPKDKKEDEYLQEKEGENLQEKQNPFFTEISVINVLNTFFGNVDEETSLEKMVELLNIIYAIQSSDYDDPKIIRNRRDVIRMENGQLIYPQIEEGQKEGQKERNTKLNENEIDGGKKRNKNRRTRRNKQSKMNRRTRRNKGSKRNKRTKRNKGSKRNIRTRRK